MMFHQRRSIYPFAIAVLTLALGVLMFVTFNRASVSPAGTSAPAQASVTDDQYREDAHAVIVPYLAAYNAATTDVERLVATEDAINGIMPLIVPTAYKDLHLGIAVALTLTRDGLRGEAGAADSGQAKLMKLIADYPWLAN